MLPASNHDHVQGAMLHPAPFEAGTAVEEQRKSIRLETDLSVQLQGMGCPQPCPCTARDLSEEGVYVRVPAEQGLSVGQRCEVRFLSNGESALPQALCDETCYATVIRTEVLEEASGPAIGAGLRFDQPLFF